MKNIILSITPVVATFLPGHPDLKHTADFKESAGSQDTD